MIYYDIEKETICMKFIYPAVFRKTENGYHAFFPDLECCEASGDTLDDAIENANEACRNWITVELEEEEPNMPYVSDIEDIEIKEEPDFSYSFIQEEGKKTTVKVSYLSNNDGTGTFMKQEAKVLSPSGEIKELKIEKVKGKYTFALETTEEPGDWKIETYNTDGENIEVEVSEENIEIIEETQEETEAIS